MAKTKKPAAKSADAGGQLNQFTLDGKTYNVVHGIVFPGNGDYVKLTPADICVHEEAQKHLVQSGSTAIQEVIE